MTIFSRLLNSFSIDLSVKRFYRNFNNSPSTKPGFLLPENAQKLAAKRTWSSGSASTVSIIPEDLSDLFLNSNSQNWKARPSLKGNINPIDINYLVSSYPNQLKPNVLTLLNINQPTNHLSFNLNHSHQISLQTLTNSLQAQFNAEALECANVLKKRRRKMRGHKHKKRLKERRHKSN